jgi:serine/threonine protein kinase
MSNLPFAPASTSPALDEHDALPAGTRFGELEILRVIGVGGFGIVYLARDHSLDRDVALKEYMPGQLAARGPSAQVSLRSGSHMETFALGLRSFVNEARLLARFDHRSLVKVYRFWEANNTAYMVMPFLQGRTLREVRRAMTNPPDEAWMRQTINPLLDALELLHREAVYHRDIAPDNILLPNDGSQAVLLDFGAARRAIGDRTQTFTAILKPSYAPIEQYAESVSLRQGPWTDIYALGAAIHYLVKGVPPPPATARTIEDHSEVLANMVVSGVSSTYLAAVDWALAVRPQDRPQSVTEFRDALDGKIKPPVVSRKTTSASVTADPYVKTAADPVISEAATPHETAALPLDEPTMLHRPGHGTGIAPASAPVMFAAAPVQSASVPWVPPTLPVAPPTATGDPTAPFKSATPADIPVGVSPSAKPQARPSTATDKPSTAKKRVVAASLAAPVQPSVHGSRLGPWPIAISVFLVVLAAAAWWWSTRVPVASDLTGTSPTAAGQTPTVSPVQAPAQPPVLTPTPTATADSTVPLETPVGTQTADEVTTSKPGSAQPLAVPAPAVTQTPVVTTAVRPPAPVSKAPPPAARPADPVVLNPNKTDTAAPRIVLESKPTRPMGSANETPRPTETPAANTQRPAGAPLWPPVPAESSKPRPQAATESVSSPTEACGGRVFIALLQCIERQCNSGRFASHPQCVEVRARREQPTQDVYGGGR